MRAGRGDYPKRNDHLWRQGGGGGGATLTAAIANGVILPESAGSVFLADGSFLATATTADVFNDSLVTVPDGTKLFIGRVTPLDGRRIVQAFICADPEA